MVQVEENYQTAYEHMPEAFSQVTMLYVDMEVGPLAALPLQGRQWRLMHDPICGLKIGELTCREPFAWLRCPHAADQLYCHAFMLSWWISNAPVTV